MKNIVLILAASTLIATTAVAQVKAKNKPSISKVRLTTFKRAKSLDNGVSISWLEQTWNKDILKRDIDQHDFNLLKVLGFKSIRLPVAFGFFEQQKIPLDTVLKRIDAIVNLCNKNQFKLVIDCHYGELNDTSYLTETPRIINIWLILTKRYKNVSADNLLFEIYNEPPHMNEKIWKDAAYNITTAIRKVDVNRTLIVGASNFNSIYELSRFVRLADENIIYTFHFYEPFFFTHQGADWVGDQVATVGVPFPYSAEKFPKLNPKAKNTWGETNYAQYSTDGNEQALFDKLTIAKKWGEKYGVPILCGEYGVYNQYADLDSRCRYIKAMRKTLKTLNIPGMLWDYNGTFSIFTGNPSIETLPDCMKDAIGYGVKN
ncbi:glycoside hydrolase family 5 protein [Mucilaginibacter auburnensis]|uniref:Aryl-phospho-beta-D-glucosidase BglC (GH1 family) n=1 Tax=Mucilaginibacter auburnensis TaxID=1457233 RepID=A0A2H9VQ21_9SPHI|nr:cellulase family glycosylhydrolase [Mucilaginibacter auburnensis]PJJ80449.1 aryl-phospho-beta-D-glucosidase BglC (GH1 family) [Mucilaginibacter auburnensis]